MNIRELLQKISRWDLFLSLSAMIVLLAVGVVAVLLEECRHAPDAGSGVLEPAPASTDTTTGFTRSKAIRRLASPSDPLGPHHPALRDLIRLVRSDVRERGEVQKALAEATDPVLRGHLLYVLYAGTDEVQWLNQLVELALSRPELPSEFWNIFGAGD